MSGDMTKAIGMAERAGARRWCMGDAYLPLHRVQEISSDGERKRYPYQGRMVHLLSRLEQRALRHFQWDLAVTGIEEQYYLEVEDTTRIALEAGASHPLLRPAQDGPFPMSTDLVIYYRTDTGPVRIARQMKYSKEFELGGSRDRDRRKIEHVIEKLEIERRYWAERNVDWQILTERELSETRQHNIENFLGFKLDPKRPHGFWTDAVDRVRDALAAGDGLRLVDLAESMDARGTLDHADFTSCVRHLVAKRELAFDMELRFDPLRPVSDFRFVAEPMRLAA